MSVFSGVKWLSLQQPLILAAAMMTGKNVNEILNMEVHERAKLLDTVIGEVKDVTAAAVAGTDPAGPGGVTLTEGEMALIIDEAADPKEAAKALLDYRVGGEDGGEAGS